VNVWSRTCCRAGRGASVSSGRPEQRKKRGAAVNVYPAPPPSSSRRRLHRRPNVTRPAALPFLALYPSFESLPVSAPSSRCAPVPSSFPHERPPNHASSVVAWHLGDPTPSLQDAYVRVPLHCSRCRLGRGTPHDAPPRRVPRCASRLCVPAFVPCWFCVGGGFHTRAAAMRTPALNATTTRRPARARGRAAPPRLGVECRRRDV
jgi:hypothetical protein